MFRRAWKTSTIIDNPTWPKSLIINQTYQKIENNKHKEEIKNAEKLCRDNQKIPLPKVLINTEADKIIHHKEEKKTKVYLRFNCEKTILSGII